MSGGALYVYAVVPAPATGELVGELAGIDGLPVRTVVSPGGVAALVHEADPVPYQGPDDEVKRWVLEHSRVVEDAWEAAGTVLPVTFNVLVRPDGGETAADRLRAWLQAEAAAMRQTLERLRGRAELRVDISLDRSASCAADPELQALRAGMERRPPGMRRLLERKAEQLERQAADRVADRLYPEYRRRVAGHVEEFVEQRRSSALTGTVPVLSAAVLVRGEEIGSLGGEIARIQDEQPAVRIRFLGPWPPYSFAQEAANGPAGRGSASGAA